MFIFVSRAGVSPNGDASTILNYLSTLVSVAQFDALAPYHPTSEGILAKLMKRPYHERSMENKNIAAIYAGGKLLMQLVPSQTSTMRQMFWKLRLDPDDNQVRNLNNYFRSHVCLSFHLSITVHFKIKKTVKHFFLGL